MVHVLKFLQINHCNEDDFTEYLEEIGHPSSDIVISGETGNIGVIRYKDEFKQEEVNKFKADIAEDLRCRTEYINRFINSW